MFSFSELPQIQTRKALLILDLQNDFVKANGKLPVRNVPDFVDHLAHLTQSFRRDGNVIWVQTQFNQLCPVIDPATGNEVVVLGRSAANNDSTGHAANTLDAVTHDDQQTASQWEHDSSAPDADAFLTYGGPNYSQRCCVPNSTGAQFPAPILSAIDHERDTVLVKSDYSAFQSPTLVLSFRTQFITELFLCGSLSNASVYATALDAVRHGFSVTIVEDCVGYRSFTRHVEAMRRMADIMGVSGITSKELMEEHEWQETKANRFAGPSPSVDASSPVGIEGDMDDLAVKPSHIPPRRSPPRRSEARLLSRSPESNEVTWSGKSAGTRQKYREYEAESHRRISDGDRGLLGSSRSSNEESENIIDAQDDEDDVVIPPFKLPRSASKRQQQPSGPGQSQRANRPRMRRAKRPGDREKDRNESTKPNLEKADSSAKAKATSTTSIASSFPAASSPDLERMKSRKNVGEFVGPGDSIGEGDSSVVYDLELPTDAFQRIRDEVKWQKMYHLSGEVPRLVAVQGHVQPDQSIPIYRHPADESPQLLPFSKTVDGVRKATEKILKHPLNHVLIQLYRDGQDSISEHSDKTLDIVRGSYICNVSLGAQRTMVLRTKQTPKAPSAPDNGATNKTESGRQTQKVPLPHNSLFILGEKTNMRWLHGIRPDKRPTSEKTGAELDYAGERISLTFRHIGTFIKPQTDTIWGQGAVSKSMENARPVAHGNSAEVGRMVKAFGQENHQSDFDWNTVYGQGFDVVNFVTTSPGRLLPSGNDISDLRVQLCLVESGLRYTLESRSTDDVLPPSIRGLELPSYIESDGTTAVSGDINILSHIGTQPPSDPARPRIDPPRGRMQQAEGLRESWQRFQSASATESPPDLQTWEQTLRENSYIGGQSFGVDDCALWPVIREIAQYDGHDRGQLDISEYPAIAAYYQKVGKRSCVKKVLEEGNLLQ